MSSEVDRSEEGDDADSSDADESVPESESPSSPEEASPPSGQPTTAGGSDGPAADEQYCSSCGSVVKSQAEICPECGVRLQDSPASEKNAGLAAVLSFFVTGLGQIYNGQVGKGLALIAVQFVNILLMFVVIGLLTYPIVWIYGVYDAYVAAERINEGEVSP